MKTPSERAFTLLEIMLTIALVAVAIVPMLRIREQCTRQSYQARNANLARMLARELMSEIEFHGLDQISGQIDGYPGFSYEAEIQEVDLITGKDEQEDEEKDDPFNSSRDSTYQPADAVWAADREEEKENQEYPARRVRLTLFYPNVARDASEEPLKLVIETLFAPLPEEDSAFANRNT
ncbi:MAG: type II secretion system protein [Planctomycetes bacterium]|nr:type II secretion system protein [Planctomycetota bacterium]